MDFAGSAGSSSLGGAEVGSGPCDSPNALKLGKWVYVEDGGGGRSSSSRAPGKGAGGPRKQQKTPMCQVEGCKEDLTGVKAYYCKHKVCGMHSKSPKVIVAGLEQRFCQQCSRFHQLPEFDQGKRSCRRRLAGHNERRRKPPLSSLASRYRRLSSSFHDVGSYGGFVMDFAHSRLQSVSSDWQGSLNIPQLSRTMSQVIQPQSRSSPVGTFFSGQDIPPDGSFGSSDSSCALSLLSTQPWGASRPSTAIASSRGPAVSRYDFECAPMAQLPIASTYLSSSQFKGQEIGHSSNDIHCEMGLGLGAYPGNRPFSVELELAEQLNGQCLNHAHGRAYGPSDNIMHWSL